MNAMLLEMIAARATASGNSALLEMVSRLRSSNGTALMQDPQELLAKLGASGNPLVTALAKQFSEAQANALRPANEPVIDVEPESTPESADAPRGAPEYSPAETEELQQRVEAMSFELRTLRERCDLLAAALGACCLCWGQDPACRACRGRGRPGYAIPDEPLVHEFVLPAIRTLRAQKASLNGVPAKVPRTTAEVTA
jgi:hypothetical protein